MQKGDGRCIRIAVNPSGQEVGNYDYGRNCSTERTNYQVGVLGGLSNPAIYNGFNIILYPEQNPKGNEWVLQDTGIYNGKFWRAYDAGGFGWKAVAIPSLSEYLPDYDFSGKLDVTNSEETVSEEYRSPRKTEDVPYEFIAAGILGLGITIYGLT